MSQINVNTIKNKSGNGAPNFPSGVTVTGVATATSFVGALDGDNISSGTIAAARVATLNQNTTGTAALAEGLTGTPSITVQDITGVGATFTGNITGVGATFTGNVSIGGTLTYSDVTNIDSVGLVTARLGVHATAGVSTFQTNTSGSYVAEFDNQHASGRGVKVKASSVAGAQNVVLLEDAAGNNLVEVKSTGKVVVNKHSVHMDAGANVTGVVTATSYEGRHSQVPKNAKSGAYTLLKTDSGQCISTNSAVTVPNAVFASGDAITVFNDSASAIALTQGSGLQLRKAGSTTTGNLSIKEFGLVTIWFNTGGTAIASGNLA